MDEWIQIPDGVLAQVASYTGQVVSHYKNNPLIEALPNIKSKEDVIQLLASYPSFDAEERLADSHYRFHMIQQLLSYFQPLPITIDLEARISRLIRQGYVNRNPLTPQYASNFVRGYRDIQNGQISQTNHNSVSALTIIGVSGIGKSTALNRILQTMPQIISHCDYRDKQLSMYQITYLKLECPPDGSIRGLINNFFTEIDRIVGTNHLNRFGRNGKLSAASLIPIVAQIARSFNLGILVVDEIQNLSLARSGGAEQMLSFFVTLSNSIGLPTILIGTPRAMSLFSEFRIARRGSSQGDMVWEPMRKDEQSWRLFIEGLWDYQWIRNPTPLTPELNNAIHEASCGITDIAIKTFIMSQIKAITSGTEKLSLQLIKGVAKDNLKLVQPMLDALRSGNAVQIAKYADIQPIQIEGFVAAEQSKLDVGNIIKTFQKAHQDQKLNIERLEQDAIVRLTLLGIEEKEAKRQVNEVLIKQPELQNVREIVQAAYKIYLGVLKPELVRAEKIQTKDELDLRTIVKVGKDKGKSAYQSLKDAGIITSDFVLN